ncbi:hypothetical protein AZ66_06210 [Paenibacillus sp. E194]|uniref:Uncharacterized protein n=2 Tax=Paenibacillus alvei TaxID=44250 RepID=S9UE26_PAEAL|nr:MULTISPECIES: hypothetical protein [Paenibacillus]EPY08720.1 hypothetical protein PAALTS15_03215 [Paenibacillus alvei TS-15]KJB88620.1 hypothetical protein AZ66_06210 [Paenibacillus sp. E194]SYX87216.1 conserved protein of unknown function [Paenibacillus alvei]
MKFFMIPEKWRWNGIVTIGGILVGAGIADCIYSLNRLDLNQLARGLTIFSAGLTILVVMDNTKTQRATEKIQIENELRLQRVEEQLNAIHQSQHMTEQQLHEIKALLNKSNS